MGKLYVVATPIGNLHDMSERAIETLKAVDLIAAEDTRHTIKLLNHFNIKCKMVSYHKFNEKERTEEIINRIMQEDINVALVSDAGTPCISDPGYELVRQAREAGIHVIGISGPSAAITALSISGFNTDKFTFLGFLPREKSERYEIYKNIKKSDVNTFIMYESPKRIINLAAELKDIFTGAKVCFCSDLTKLYEKVYYGDIEKVYEELIQNENSSLGEYTVVLNKENLTDCYDENHNETNENVLSIEALLMDVIIKKHCSLKEAVEDISKMYEDYSKKEIYKASLNLKDVIKDIFGIN